MFANRTDAGKKLALKLTKYEKRSPLVLALPRGGVSVGFPIAQSLHAPLDVVITRKIGAPYNPEFGIGAIAEDGVAYFDAETVEMLQITQKQLKALRVKEAAELERRISLYRSGRSLPLLTNKTVILVDDGLATGVTARAALLAIKKHHPKKIIFAVPVCPKDIIQKIRRSVDTFICLETPEHLEAIGAYYRDFHQVTDEEVMAQLQGIQKRHNIFAETKHDFSHKIVW